MKLSKLGPGLLYAGAAIGVSHLVQSSKAGALYGGTLILIVILANVLKYPFFEFGIRYATVKKASLLNGYEELGKFGTPLFSIVTVSTMFTVQAAVTVVTSVLLEEVFQFGWSIVLWSTILLLTCIVILLVGKYNMLDSLIKWVILLLSMTLIITVVAAFSNPINNLKFGDFDIMNTPDALFFIALIGWMPAPFDIAVWNSVWTTEKDKTNKRTLKEALFDFKIGYWGTTFLAVCFLLLGALMIYGTEEELSTKGAGFAKQIIKLFTNNLGDWSYYLVAFAALATMFSTTLTCLDAFPRSLSNIKWIEKRNYQPKTYWLSLILLAIISTLIIGAVNDMSLMITIATAISFISAPVLAIMNYLAVTNNNFPKEHQPNTLMKVLSWIGIAFLVGFTIYYLYILIN